MTCSGAIPVDAAHRAARALWEAPDWPRESALWDFRDAEFDLSTSEVRELARFILENQPAPPPRRIAFVTRREVDFGMARMYEVFREDRDTAFAVFRAYDEAIDWARPSGPGAG